MTYVGQMPTIPLTRSWSWRIFLLCHNKINLISPSKVLEYFIDLPWQLSGSQFKWQLIPLHSLWKLYDPLPKSLTSSREKLTPCVISKWLNNRGKDEGKKLRFIAYRFLSYIFCRSACSKSSACGLVVKRSKNKKKHRDHLISS